ncbi:MAG: AI-2E family transporter [Clostridiales bacterium]|nr:AI-2E family transporter [Clostridiales bacterium]
MKFDFNKKNNTVALYACMVVAFGVVLVFGLLYFGSIATFFNRLTTVLSPVIYGIIIAYLLNPIYKFIYRSFHRIGGRKKREKLRRVLALSFTYIFVFAVIFLFFLIIVPQLVSSYTSLVDLISSYINDASAWVNELMNSGEFSSNLLGKLFSGFSMKEITEAVQKIISNSYSAVTTLTPYVVSFVSSFVTVAMNWVIGLIISVYLLFSKETLCAQVSKTVNAVLKPEKANSLIEFARYVDNTFGKFLVGKIFDSLIIGILTFVVMTLVRVPYSALIAVVVGVTNIIPFFGPFIGAIPSVFIVLIADPIMAIWVLVIIIVIQQLDGNIIGPKIIGNTVGLGSLWIVVSIIVFGKLYGVIGMIIAVPLFSILYKLLKDWVEKRLKQKGMPVETTAYIPSSSGWHLDSEEPKADHKKKGS